ncbi:MAG: chromate efflux transporter [Alphaproteobacteria bacterium]|nr:chromate efflux transporter [Alphaproteobacteria bacterium]
MTRGVAGAAALGLSGEQDGVRRHGVSFGQALRVWLRVAALSFGGPAGQIAVMHRILVEERRWIGEARFLHALSYCTLLPGPEAQQLAIYIGWLMHRTRGGILAGTLFVLPGVISIMALSYVYAGWGRIGAVAALFFGLKSAVLAVVLQAVVRVGSRALKNRVLVGIAVVAFISIFFFGVPFPLIILAAGLFGWIGGRAESPLFRVNGHGSRGDKGLADADSLLGEELPEHAKATGAGARRAAIIWLVLWLVPVLGLVATLGSASTFSQIAIFFSEMAVVTFGGAYAVLAYVAQQAVEHYHWLRPGEMLDGLGMAETTPGPLIMVTQFVGFMAAYRDPGSLPPMLAGTLGGLLTTWVTFTPCFLWIFLGAPFIEALRDNKALSAALAAITAAVVGVILNLAVWFALHTWFRDALLVRTLGLSFDAPVPTSLDPWALALSAAALVAIFRFKAGMIPTLLTCAVAGVVLHLAFGVV